jgi:phosphoribosylformimino-5-aminoimidazole carboxamide ribotide isomerase
MVVAAIDSTMTFRARPWGPVLLLLTLSPIFYISLAWFVYARPARRWLIAHANGVSGRRANRFGLGRAFALRFDEIDHVQIGRDKSRLEKFALAVGCADHPAWLWSNLIAIVSRSGEKIWLGLLVARFHADDVAHFMRLLSTGLPMGVEGESLRRSTEQVMQIYPAIDLFGGRCVRLRQGDYQQETVFGTDPAAMARHWVTEGATWLHIVDLDGAKVGQPVNAASIRAIVEASGVPCQLGGGLRTRTHIQEALGWGVQRVIIGTRALQSPEWLAEMCAAFPGRIVLGIDAKDGRVATHGWLDVSDMPAIELARKLGHLPLAAIVYTDIGRDGMMQGANVAAMAEMAAAVPIPVIASGGVTTLEDVRRLADAGLAGCIVGRALYENQLRLREIAATIPRK